MKAAKDGPFFPDWEFETLFSFTRDGLGEMIAAWPDLSHLGSDAQDILVSIVNMFTLYPHQMEDELMKRTKCSNDDINRLADLLDGKDRSAFDRMF